MKKRINLTIEKNIYQIVKRSKKNISQYVEKLILRDITSKQKTNSKTAYSEVHAFGTKVPAGPFLNT